MGSKLNKVLVLDELRLKKQESRTRIAVGRAIGAEVDVMIAGTQVAKLQEELRKVTAEREALINATISAVESLIMKDERHRKNMQARDQEIGDLREQARLNKEMVRIYRELLEKRDGEILQLKRSRVHAEL